MQKLNIPLGKSIRTTRRPRWVVWLCVTLVMLLLVAWTAQRWFTRSELLTDIPVDAVVSFELLTGPPIRDIVSSRVGQIPIISERGFTFGDLVSVTHGKIAVHILHDGSRVATIKARPEELPSDLLDSNRIIVQPLGHDRILLSQTITPVRTSKMKQPMRSLFDGLFSTTLGYVRLHDDEIAGSIKQTGEAVELTFTSPMLPILDRPIPLETTAFLSTQVLSKNEIGQIVEGFYQPDVLNDVLELSQWIFLSQTKEKTRFVISGNENLSMNRSQTLKKILERVDPDVRDYTLPDGSFAQEITTHTEPISVEERVVLGKSFFYVKSRLSDPLFISVQDDFLLSNDEDFLRIYIEALSDETKDYCQATSLFLELEHYLSSTNSSRTFYSEDIWSELSKHFQSIAVKSQKRSTSVRLCS